MSDLIDTLRAIIRDELARTRLPELAIVTRVFPREAEGSDANHQVNVRLRESGIELVRLPVVVRRLGESALPKVDDLVVVAFAGGDLNAGLVLGCVYDDRAHPPVARGDEVVYQPPEEGRAGVRRLHLELPSGARLTADDDAVSVRAGGTEVTIHRDGDVAVKAAGNLRWEAEGDVEVRAGGKLTLCAQGNAELRAAAVQLEGQSRAELKAPELRLAGLTQFAAG